MANRANAIRLHREIPGAYRNTVAVVLALLGVAVAYALAPFANEKPMVAAVAAVFPIVLIAMVNLPGLQCLPLGSRFLLILLILRPLIDVSTTSFQRDSTGFILKASSDFTLQDGFGVIFGLTLLGVCLPKVQRNEYAKLPNLFLVVLFALTSFSWLMGGLSEGTQGFARTAWGLLVALLLGSLFQTERQIDVFVRGVFYSSFFVLLILGLNMGNGMLGAGTDIFWRLSGQYGTPNALAGVAFSFFLCGLYALQRARTFIGKFFTLVLLSLLAIVILLTQSRTVGILMLLSACIYLWASRRRWLLYGVTVPLLLFLFASTAGTGWRLISSFSLTNGQFNSDVLSLQGRIFLWGEWLATFQNATPFHRLFGLGWGAMLRSFLSMPFPNSSVTENSFLWVLIGAGALGLLAFVAYLVWVLFRAAGTWRRASGEFQRQFALLAFLTASSLVVEGLTTDVVSSPNTDVYIFAVISIFIFQYFRNPAWRPLKVTINGVLKQMETAY